MPLDISTIKDLKVKDQIRVVAHFMTRNSRDGEKKLGFDAIRRVHEKLGELAGITPDAAKNIIDIYDSVEELNSH